MIRLYRIMVEQLLMAVVYLHHGGYRPADVYGAVVRYGKERGEDGSIFRELRNYGGLDTWTELIDKLTLLLRESHQNLMTARDGDLIDTVVRILQLPHARNNLTGKTLDSLRKAILMPDELGKVLDIKRLESCCGHCGHPFGDGEMATAHIDGGCVFMCVRCFSPTVMRCNLCKDGISYVADKLKMFMGKITCGCNKKPTHTQEGEPIREVQPPAPQAQPTRHRPIATPRITWQAEDGRLPPPPARPEPPFADGAGVGTPEQQAQTQGVPAGDEYHRFVQDRAHQARRPGR